MIQCMKYVPLACFLVASASLPVVAQNVVDWNVANGDWSVSGNWVGGFVPDTSVDETANISNSGTANVNGIVATPAGEVILGQNDGQSGTLNINNGGQLTAAFTEGNTSDGGIDVGQVGTGTLNILPGGSLTAQSLAVSAQSTLTFGGSGGVASLEVLGPIGSTDDITLGGMTRITGPGHTFRAVDDVVLVDGGTLISEITSGSNHTTIQAGDDVLLGGTLRLEFGGGVTPAVGDSWNLFDAAEITGAFEAIDTSAAPALASGQAYRFAAVEDATSTNGFFGRLSVEQLLTLTVDRGSGAVSIANLGPVDVGIDGYSIGSALGGLVPGNWNSLQDQAVSDWRESPPGGGGANALSELKPTSSTDITSGSPFSLGNVFSLPVPTEIGVELEDLTFQYFQPDGSVVEGFVEYTGEKTFNNIVLTIDPDTGEAQIQNESPLSVEVDGYQITSSSGSLLVDNWSSLDDQNAAGGGWRESNGSATQLAELLSQGATTFNNGTTFNLGSPFDADSGTQDLVFEYLLLGENQVREGQVVYRAIPAGLIGDYNGNGIVDAADYAVWLNNLGSSVTAGTGADGNNNGVIDLGDYGVWKNNIGATNGGGGISSAVPEPGSMELLAVVLVTVGLATGSVGRGLRLAA